MIVDKAINSYLSARQTYGLAPGSIQEYQIQLHLFRNWLSARHIEYIEDITPLVVAAYLAYVRESYKPSVVVHKRSIMALFLNWCSDSGLLSKRTEIPKVRKARDSEVRRLTVTAEQVAALVSHVRRVYNRGGGFVAARNLALIALLFGAGLRIGEVANARVGDLNVSRRRIEVPCGKGGYARTVPLAPATLALLRLYLRCRRRIEPFYEDFLMISQRGLGMSGSGLHKIFKALAAVVGLDMTSHTGRRFAITQIAEQNLLHAQELAGHQRIETTMKYLKRDKSALTATVDKADHLRQAI